MRLIDRSFIRFHQVISLLLALHLFNISMDSRDRDPDYVPEDLSFNDLESIAEFITEVVFDWEDAFTEHDEGDSDSGNTSDCYKFFCSSVNTIKDLSDSRPERLNDFPMKNSTFIQSISREVHSPPPKACLIS